MKAIRTLATVVAMFGLSASAQAGLLDHLFGKGGRGCCDAGCDASKCCDCAPCVEPCKPVIVRPCHKNVYTYQRQLSNLKPPCCDEDCDPYGCAPAGGCVPCGAGNGCAPCGAGNACAPYGAGNACAPCGPANACAPCGPANACAPCGPGAGACAAPCGPANACAPCGPAGNACAPYGPAGGACCPANACCPGDACCPQVREDACEVAKLIYTSMTACKPGDREEAIDELDDFSEVVYPEIICAYLYALNDADPGVREEAADELGDALEEYPCLCSQQIVDALTCALADCDDDVVDQVEEALEACGYDIVDADEVACCDVACAPAGCAHVGCAPGGYSAPATQPMAPMHGGEGTAPAPAPPEEPKAYFPKKSGPRNLSKKLGLSKLFSMVN